MKASLPEYIGNQALEIINRQGCAAIRITMETIVFNGKDTHTVGFRDTSDMLVADSGAGLMFEMLPIYVPGDDNHTLGVALQTVGTQFLEQVRLRTRCYIPEQWRDDFDFAEPFTFHFNFQPIYWGKQPKRKEIVCGKFQGDDLYNRMYIEEGLAEASA